jgi:hypothetical protein
VARKIVVAPGRVLKATPVFDTYWHFAEARQALFMRRVCGENPPWTTDPVLAQHRFTNAYRASDRVSQYLIRHVIYEGSDQLEETFFRVLLFKIFNRIDTWERLVATLGPPTWRSFEFARYASVLDDLMLSGERVYSAAYIMPSPNFGDPRKHRNHLHLIEHMMRDGAPGKVTRARSLEEVFRILESYPSLGAFLAFQFTVDLNYSEIIDFSEMDFVVAGPGAKDGIRKCFSDVAGLEESDVIRAVTERANEEFERLGLSFQTLWGRPLQLIDCQNLFCEVGKYARVMHPEFSGTSGRKRYPPKWKLEPPPSLAHQSSETRRAESLRRAPKQTVLPLMPEQT